MYQILLCWRYLRTRYIALASIISVMLGVATMIVVNSVMAGFTTEMRDRIHGILSDVVVESRSLEGMPDAQQHMDVIRQVVGDSIVGMTPTVAVPAMLNFRIGGEWITRQVQLIGIDAETQGQVSSFGHYLQHPENRKRMSFHLRQGGFDTRDHQAGPGAPERKEMANAGWGWRRRVAEFQAFQEQMSGKGARVDSTTEDNLFSYYGYSDEARAMVRERVQQDDTPGDPTEETEATMVPADPFAAHRADEAHVFDMAAEQHTGIVLGIALATYRRHLVANTFEDRFLILPGEDVTLSLPTAGAPPKVVSDKFTIVDFYESKMSEYDASFVFVPIEKLQDLRGMIDPATGVRYVSSIQIKLKPGVDGAEVRDKLQAAFSDQLYVVSTWQDKQGALLAAVQMETSILNVLLFLIITVAGFGILAIFLMIVVEKTRDIGILKSLGASGGGILIIFLSYGLLLGVVGSGVGMVLGLLFVRHINEIAGWLGWITGKPVFDPEIYYFYEIPAIINPLTVGWIVLGAVAIAVLASILPAYRAARLHPVEALRYE